jgi:hypothetical protein
VGQGGAAPGHALLQPERSDDEEHRQRAQEHQAATKPGEERAVAAVVAAVAVAAAAAAAAVAVAAAAAAAEGTRGVRNHSAHSCKARLNEILPLPQMPQTVGIVR